ncbi:MAG: ATP synthase F1 subunit epsilon [Desulfobacterium sp.]|nr:ATP synthase F1 subunit epsilon [Desulfobacterium sp.]
MAENIKLEIVTPDNLVVDDEVQIVMAPGTDGEFGILKGHTPFLTSLKVGTVIYKDTLGKERLVFVSGGFAEALPDKVTILAESAERRRDIDQERAKQAMERAEKRLASHDESIDYVRAKAALIRAMYRLKVTGYIV